MFVFPGFGWLSTKKELMNKKEKYQQLMISTNSHNAIVDFQSKCLVCNRNTYVPNYCLVF